MPRDHSVLIYVTVTPDPKGECQCAEFLQPISSWKEIAQRHDDNAKHRFSKTFKQISDASEDYTVDLFRCVDCGRYWAREDCGLAWMTRSYTFYYFADTTTPGDWLHHARHNGVKRSLIRDDEDFKTLIAPHLPLEK